MTSQVRRLKETTRLNMAACYLKLGEHQKCVDACNQALELGQNPKAYFRRAQAYLELSNFSRRVRSFAQRDQPCSSGLGPELLRGQQVAPQRLPGRSMFAGGLQIHQRRTLRWIHVMLSEEASVMPPQLLMPP
ncbi:unnamed protein product [Cladocopium goreaui]|uniref:Uncharacterized protein n=1 Tax=Cladocopium goreaui TaxID=2562237 RepID=A0A9P1BNB2_9DINO|nr:unnamed protein product [Cladocopium goreaui]